MKIMNELEAGIFEEVAERVKNIRLGFRPGKKNAIPMNQKEMALLLGVGQTYISEIELRKLTPSIKFFMLFSKTLLIPIDYILNGCEKLTDLEAENIKLMGGKETLRAVQDLRKEAKNYFDSITAQIQSFQQAIIGKKNMVSKVYVLNAEVDHHVEISTTKINGQDKLITEVVRLKAHGQEQPL